ncbi:MAG: LacI family transcriptional regulator [Spirochaetaceae bacterium]|nr:LacI family transcriptional regulator [Spirochaetaceae bacterium]MCF7939621.1 LacI family transcriptional regulator [Spirochaetales bacterium]
MGIKNIAQKAGVSVATVSRVLNGTKFVSEDLRKKVMRVIDENGYVANHVARSMVLKKTFTAGLIIPNISEMFHQIIFSSVEETLEEADYKVIVCKVRDHPNHEQVYLDLLLQNRTDGIILMHETSNPDIYTQLRKANVPIVLSGIDIPALGSPQVRIDDYRAACDGTEYLVGLGHTRIGLIGGWGHSVGDIRVQGFHDVLKTHGIRHYDGQIAVGGYTIESGCNAMHTLIAKHPELTAVFVLSDEMAIGVYTAIREAGKQIPEDISVLGFDGIDIGRYLYPSLSTVQQPIREIGKRSADLLLSMMNGEPADSQRLILSHEVVERASCRRLT